MQEPVTPPDPFRLHIGAEQASDGWQVLDARPGAHVDYVGDCADLGRFPDACCNEIYASHVLEHLPYRNALRQALDGFRRILKPGGELRVSVPDLDVLCRVFIHPDVTAEQRYHVMRVMFGGQLDAFDFHKVGFNFEILERFLKRSRFRDIRRVDAFDLFEDSSSLRLGGHPISLNVIATR